MNSNVNNLSGNMQSFQPMAPAMMQPPAPQHFQGVGAQPIVPQLPPPRPGFFWAPRLEMVTSLVPFPNGTWGPVSHAVTKYYQMPIPLPIEHAVPLLPAGDGSEQLESKSQQTAEKVDEAAISRMKVEKEVVESKDKSGDVDKPVLEEEDLDEAAIDSGAESEILDDHGAYGDSGAVLMESPLHLLGSPLSGDAIALLSPLQAAKSAVDDEIVDHSEALRLYRKDYQKFAPLPSRGGDLYRYEEKSTHGFYGWKEAALHFLPLEIIDNLERFVYFEDSYIGSTEECPRFLIPCSAKSKGKHKFEIKKGVIEITLSPDGKPLHIFLRPMDGRSEEYMAKNLDELQEDYEDAQFKASFPTLSVGVKHKQSKRKARVGRPVEDGIYFKCVSKYNLEITIPKK